MHFLDKLVQFVVTIPKQDSYSIVYNELTTYTVASRLVL